MQIAGGWMECRGSAGAGEGQVHAGTLPALSAHWVHWAQSSVHGGALGQADIFGPAKGFRSRVGGGQAGAVHLNHGFAG